MPSELIELTRDLPHVLDYGHDIHRTGREQVQQLAPFAFVGHLNLRVSVPAATGYLTPSSTGTNGCTGNDDCGNVEVCFNGECAIATEVGYRVEITSWQPEDCGTFGTPDLYVVVSRNGNDGPPTATARSCPAAWSSFCIDGPVDAANVIEFQLWDADVGGDDVVDHLCWPTPTDPNASCGPLSPSMLHDGGYTGGTAINGQISISFTPGC